MQLVKGMRVRVRVRHHQLGEASLGKDNSSENPAVKLHHY